MNDDNLTERMDRAIEKHLEGLPLDEWEQRVVAYTWTVGGCHACGGSK